MRSTEKEARNASLEKLLETAVCPGWKRSLYERTDEGDPGNSRFFVRMENDRETVDLEYDPQDPVRSFLETVDGLAEDATEEYGMNRSPFARSVMETYLSLRDAMYKAAGKLHCPIPGMCFEEAKKREDYSFALNGIEDVIDGIRKGCLDGFTEYAEPMRGAAVMEVGYVDIEVNIFSEAQVTTLEEKKNDLTPVIDYFVCVKNADGEWTSDDYLDSEVKVDWNSGDWQEQLEQDMFTALDEYVKKKGYHYDRPNFIP